MARIGGCLLGHIFFEQSRDDNDVGLPHRIPEAVSNPLTPERTLYGSRIDLWSNRSVEFT